MFKIFVWASFPALLVGSCGFAWWRGSAAERWASVLILVADAIGDTALAACYPAFPGLSMCLIDLFLAIGLLLVALKYSSIWLGAAMLLQSLALCIQAFDLGGDGPSANVHVMLNDAISYTMLICVIVATTYSWRAQRRRCAAEGFPAYTSALTHPV